MFEKEKLIATFSEDGQSWHPPSACIWSIPSAEVRGKKDLAAEYDPSLEAFFVDVVGVPRLDITMVYHELMNTAAGDTVEMVKGLLRVLSSLLLRYVPDPSQLPQPLLQRPILPVRLPNGEVQLCSWDESFVIMDRKHLGQVFCGKVKILNFDLQELHELKPFIRWAGLSTAYISYMVRETSILNPGEDRRVSDPRFDIRHKAHGLVRYAIHQGFRDVHLTVPRGMLTLEPESHRISKARELRATERHCTIYCEVQRPGRPTGCPPRFRLRWPSPMSPPCQNTVGFTSANQTAC